MASAYDRIFHQWHFRSRDYTFLWNGLVALHSYKLMNAYLANPPPPSYLPSVVFGECWVAPVGVGETKTAMEKDHAQFLRGAPGWEYGLWSLYFLFRVFEQRIMYPLIADRDGKPARWYQLGNPNETRASFEAQFGRRPGLPDALFRVQHDASSQYGVTLIWDCLWADHEANLEQMSRVGF